MGAIMMDNFRQRIEKIDKAIKLLRAKQKRCI